MSTKPAIVFNRTRGARLSSDLEYAIGLRAGARGLLGRAAFEPGQAMLFAAHGIPVMWMHTIGMRFPIDIVFLDGLDRVVRIDHDLRPWRFSSLVTGARRALELPSGTARRTGTAPGDQIVIEPDNAPFR